MIASGAHRTQSKELWSRKKKTSVDYHSTASYLAMNGASLVEIAEVLGHKTLQMVRRYAHLSEGHVTDLVTRLNQKILASHT